MTRVAWHEAASPELTTPGDSTKRLRRSRCDYILSPDRRLFKTVQIRKPQYYVSDHRMVVAKYLLEPAKCHYRYLKGRKALPFAMPSGPMPKMDFLFQQVVDQTPVPPRRNDPARKPWISEETLKIWDVESGKCLTTLEGHRYLCLFCAIAVGKS